MAGEEAVVDAVVRLMVESIGMTTIALAQASPDVELSFPQWRALMLVGSGGGIIRVGQIAARIGSTVPTTSRLLRRLERRGLLTTERDESDRRATLVRLSPAGERLRTELFARRSSLVREALARRGADLPAGLAEGLRELGEALRAYE